MVLEKAKSKEELRACFLFSTIFVIGFYTLYVRGVIDFGRMIVLQITLISIVLFTIVFNRSRKIRIKWSGRHQPLWQEILFVVFGALAVPAFLVSGGTLLLFSLETFLQSAGVSFNLFPLGWWLFFCYVFGPVIGGLLAYFISTKIVV